jgi:hypothetical protein
MLRRLRAARLRRCYRRIALLEQKVEWAVSSGLRADFASETFTLVDVIGKRQGVQRPQRRQMKRRLVNGKTA